MLGLQDAKDVLGALQKLVPDCKVRITLPYEESALCALRAGGLMPMVERTAWNDAEIVISIPNRIDQISTGE